MDYDRLRTALAAFDATAAARHQAWMVVHTNAGVAACEAADLAELRKLQQVFYEETKEYNTLSNCQLVDAEDIRRMIRRKDGAG
jgi:hypothetical protein